MIIYISLYITFSCLYNNRCFGKFLSKLLDRKCVFSHVLTVCPSISPVGCCALATGFACGPGGPLVAQAVRADCAAICWEWTAGPGPVGQAFTCRRETGTQASCLIKILRTLHQDSEAEAVTKKGRGYQSWSKYLLKTKVKVFIRK